MGNRVVEEMSTDFYATNSSAIWNIIFLFVVMTSSANTVRFLLFDIWKLRVRSNIMIWFLIVRSTNSLNNHLSSLSSLKKWTNSSEKGDDSAYFLNKKNLIILFPGDNLTYIMRYVRDRNIYLTFFFPCKFLNEDDASSIKLEPNWGTSELQ